MRTLCLTLRIPAPSHLRHYSFFDIGESSVYEDHTRNTSVMDALAVTCMAPLNTILLNRLQEYDGKFRLAFILAGPALDYYERSHPALRESFKALAATGLVEFVAEPQHYSLASVYSAEEFEEQVILHRDRLRSLTGTAPTAFRNTGLITSQEIASRLEQLGFRVLLGSSRDTPPGRRKPAVVSRPASCASLSLLAEDTAVSAQLATRFTDPNSPDPLPPAVACAKTLQNAGAAIIPLTLDLAGFSGTDRDPAGLFEFMDRLPEAILASETLVFDTPTHAAASARKPATLSLTDPVSGVPPAHDLSLWSGNEMQKDALSALYLLEPRIRGQQDPVLLHLWRILQSANHFEDMSTRKGSQERTPYDAYINFMNILTDLSERLGT